MKEAHMHKRIEGQIHFSDNVKFVKYGNEIAERAEARIKVLANDIENEKKAVAAICKKREINLEEAVKEASDGYLFDGDIGVSNAFSTVAAVLQNSPAKAMEEIRKDVQDIQQAANRIVNKKAAIDSMSRLARNVDKNVRYELTWDEIVMMDF